MTRHYSTILCGITYKQIMDVACEGLTFAESAERLGVDASYLRRVLKRRAMMHWFRRSGGMPKGKRFPGGYKGITITSVREAIAEEGSIAAAARKLGADRGTVYKRLG